MLKDSISIKSSLNTAQFSEIEKMADAIVASFPVTAKESLPNQGDSKASDVAMAETMRKLSYGLFVLTAKDGSKDNGCIINTASQATSSPMRLSVTVNKANFTHDMILKTGEFNVSILTESTPFRIIEQFGFSSGKDSDKFAGCDYDNRTHNGIRYLPVHTNGVISAKVTQSIDCGTHTLFLADVTQALTLSGEPSVTYKYYFDNIRPAPPKPKEAQKGFVCKICGYVYEGDSLPDGFICPLCKHGVEDFEKL